MWTENNVSLPILNKFVKPFLKFAEKIGRGKKRKAKNTQED